MEELKPCPCGAIPEVREGDDADVWRCGDPDCCGMPHFSGFLRYWYWVECLKCGNSNQLAEASDCLDGFDYESDAIEDWNSRANKEGE